MSASGNDFRGGEQMQLDNASYRFIPAEAELRSQAIALHRQRYMDIGFMPRDFQDPYEERALYFVAWRTEQQQVIGVCRLLRQELRTLPTCAHFALFPHEREALEHLKPGTYTELGALAKLPDHPDVTPGLVAAALTHASAQRMTHLLCCIDQRLFHTLRTHLALPFRIIGEERLFHGSIKIPCALSISETLERLAASRPRTPSLSRAA
jgi:hypothetical protein